MDAQAGLGFAVRLSQSGCGLSVTTPAGEILEYLFYPLEKEGGTFHVDRLPSR